MAETYDVFLSYSRNDRPAALDLCEQFRQHGLTSMFRDDASIGAGERWLDRLQHAVDGCGAFVVLIGRDAVARWVGAETQVALYRHFDAHDDSKRLPIFPILLSSDEVGSSAVRPLRAIDSLPAFLRLFQATVWKAGDTLPEQLLEQVRTQTITTSKDLGLADGERPFVGLHSFRAKDAKLFFGRRKETLEALACFFDVRPGKPPVRWLEIDGNSGSGKSSLMNAGLLPLVAQGWLWRPRVRFISWIILGPMMPGERPITTFAQVLASTFTRLGHKEEMADVRRRLEEGDERALAEWLKSRLGLFPEGTAFLLAIDQFEELFTFADRAERERFDRLLANALEDNDCPLFVISTVRSDFNHCFAEDLPRLVRVRNQAGRWTMCAIGEQGLREIIDGPAGLAGLDVSEVREMLIRDVKSEPGALPLLENALTWLWDRRACDRDSKPKLSGKLLNAQDGAAGILSDGAEEVLATLDEAERSRALGLLLQLVRVDPEGVRHTRQTISLTAAIDAAGRGERGRALVNHLAGIRARTMGMTEDGPVRLITVADEGVTLIHETLIRSRQADAAGKPQPYWPTLWNNLEQHRGQAVARERTRLLGLEIEDLARKWDAAQRAEDLRWPEDRVLSALRDIRRSGLAVIDVIRPGISRAFCGPADPHEIIDALALNEADDATRGSGRYGEDWRSPLGHKRRAALAERLAIVGDPRPGIGLDAEGLPEIDWVPLASGTVEIDGETFPIAPFSMARYPVTIAQFNAFVAECFRGGAWQLPPGFPWLLPNHPPQHAGAHENQAADSVSWFDAQGFCHWLNARLVAHGRSAAVRLPTETEWQLAATGGDPARLWPWGADWDPEREPWRANTKESGLGRALPVGFYPLGASPNGILDMAGNLWEWCETLYDKSKKRAQDTALRVLRGGSWDYNQDLARSAYRSGVNPNVRLSNIGFRVVCSSPSSGH